MIHHPFIITKGLFLPIVGWILLISGEVPGICREVPDICREAPDISGGVLPIGGIVPINDNRCSFSDKWH